MSTSKRLRAPLIAVSGVLMAVATFAGPASAETTPGYPVSAGTQVLGTTATAVVPAVAPAQVAAAAPAEAAGTGALAFTGANAIGIGALGGLLLVGGVTMVVVGKRRKVDA
jgi:hypothetical protein